LKEIAFPAGVEAAADGSDVTVARAALARLNPQRATDFDQIRLIGRLLHGVSEGLYDEWFRWASAHPGYTPERCGEVWKSFATSSCPRLGLGLLIKLAREDADDDTFPKGVEL
jgi:hypothetical protein